MVLALLSVTSALAAGTYDLMFFTYFGGSNWEHARDIAVDRRGNMYVVGGASSADFPTTPGAYTRTIRTGGSQDFGPCDVFVTKFAPDGHLLWSTLIGGPHYDRGYGVEMDDQGFVYVAGRAGPGFPVKNAFQPDFNGVDNGSYGMQNAFVLKLAPDGSDLVWASYVDVSTLCRDIAIDPNGDVYVPCGRWNTTKAVTATSGSARTISRLTTPAAPMSLSRPLHRITRLPAGHSRSRTGAATRIGRSASSLPRAPFWQARSSAAAAPRTPMACTSTRQDTLFDQAINDLGINRVRLEIRSGVENSVDNWAAYEAGMIDYQTWRSRRYATINDNADPRTINESGFQFSQIDNTIDRRSPQFRHVMLPDR